MTPTANDVSLLVRQTINSRYELLDEPRQGGFAYVYRAYDTRLDRVVALKVLKPEQVADPRWRASIHTDIQNWAQIPAHPNIISLIDHGTDEVHQVDYLTMEWVDGPTLDEWRGGPTLIKEIDGLLDIALWCGEGVRIVHQQGLVHGGLTPRNILLDKPNGAWIPKLTDLGLAMTDSRPAKVGDALKYAAPEQIKPGGTVGHWTDIYALGTVLFYLFSGSHYLGEIAGGEAEWRKAILSKPALSLQSVLGACNSDLNLLLAAMLQKDPRGRPSIDQVQERLHTIQGRYAQPAQAAAPSVEIPHLDKPLELELHVSQFSIEPLRENISVHLAKHPQRGPELRRVRDSESLVAALVEIGAGYDCYVFNDGEGQNPGERRIVIRLATDTGNLANQNYYQPIHKTLELLCVQVPRQNYLLMLRASFTDIEDGQRQRHALAARFKFVTQSTGTRLKGGLPLEAIRQIAALPQGLEPDIQVQQRLQHWATYLDIWERAVKEKEFVVKFVGWKSDPKHPDEILFQLRGDIPWQLLEDSRRNREAISLRKYHEDYNPGDTPLAGGPRDDPNAYEDIRPAVGAIERVYQDRRTIQVVLDEDFIERHWDNDKNLPRIDTEGYLAYVSFGDLAQIRQQRTALNRLAKGDTTNWRLNQFVFDAGRAEYPDSEGIHLRRDQLLLPSLNDDQFKAVEGALNAPDLYLIQGPPGTGKTTVIAELCYQFTRRGQRVLVSSQSNLAVDNALSRLAHHPQILALRIGREKSVEPEGEPFTEEKVVNTWFERTAQDCDTQLHIRQQQMDHFASLFHDLGRVEHYADMLSTYAATLTRLEQARQKSVDDLNEAKNQRTRLESQREGLPNLYRLLYQSGKAIQAGDIALFDSEQPWRSEIVDFVALPEYQEHLARIAAAIHLLDWLRVDTDAIMARTLLPDERHMLKRLGAGDEQSGQWPHRPEAILYAGETLYKTVRQHIEELGRLKTALGTLENHLNQYSALKDKQTQITHLLAMTDLRDRLGTTANRLNEARIQCDSYRQAEELSHNQAQHLAHREHEINITETKIAEIQSVLAERETILQEIKQMRSAIQTLITSQSQGLKAVIHPQEQVIEECRQVSTNPTPYLAAVRLWITEENSEHLDAVLPQPLVGAIKRCEWHGIASVFGQLVQITEQTLSEYQKVLPAHYQENIPIDTYDPSLDLFQEVSALFVFRGDSYLPLDEMRVCQQFTGICQAHVQNLRNASQFEQGRDELGYLTLVRNSLDELYKEYLKLNAEWLANDENLKAELQAIAQEVIVEENEKLRRLRESEIAAQEQTEVLIQGATTLDNLMGQSFALQLTEAIKAVAWDNPNFTPLLDWLNNCKSAVSAFWNEQAVQLGNLQERIVSLQNELSTAQSELSAAQSHQDHCRQQAKSSFTALADLLHEQEPIPAASDLALDIDAALVHYGNDYTNAITALLALETTARSLYETVDQETTDLSQSYNPTALDQDKLKHLAAQYQNTLDKWQTAIEHELEAANVQSLAGTPSQTLDEWQVVVQDSRAALEKNAALVAKLNALALIKTLSDHVREREKELSLAYEAAVQRQSSCEQHLLSDEQQVAEYQDHYHSEHEWWETVHAAVPTHLVQDMANEESIHQMDYVQTVLKRARTAEWKQEMTRQTELVRRTEPLVRDWIKRLKENQRRDAEALRELYVANANVLGVTCGQVPRLTKRNSALSFDVVIVDEVSKATLPELLMPMSVGHKIILVGDHKQLPPMVQDNSLQEVAEQLKIPREALVHFKQSLFGNLYNSAAKVLRHMLTEQYRMRPAIMHAINQFYDHQLTGGHQRPHNLPVAGLDHDTALAWVTTPNNESYYEVQDGSSFANPKEVDLIEQMLDQMNTAWLPHVTAGELPKEVGVITFYMAQFNRFRKRSWHTRFNALHIRIGTVDRFQGMERDIILVSLVRNNPHHNIGFAKEPERINVAFSRARELLVIVGCQQLFAQSARHAYEATAAYAEIAKIVEREGKVIGV